MRSRIRGVAALRRRACIARLALLVVVVTLVGGCTTPTSRIRVPPCVDQITVAGQHARGSRTTLILDHTYDLPFTQTEIAIEGRDGKVRELVVTNSAPDVWRLIGGGLVGALGAALVTRYALAVSDGEDVVATGWFWALPVGLLAGGLAGGMVLTGWHPPGDTVIDYECPEP